MSNIYNDIKKEYAKEYMEEVSNCCYAPIIPETDFCSKCHEHCAVDRIDEDEVLAYEDWSAEELANKFKIQ